MTTDTSTAPTESDALRSERPRTRAQRTRARWGPAVWRRVGAAVASGLLLAAAYPPFDLGPLALVALVPLLWAWRGATPRRAALYGFWFGIAFFGVLLSWTWYFGAVAYAPLVAAGGAYIAAPGALVAGLGRFGVRSPWLTGAAWVLFEQLRGRFPFGGLPWGETGAALHDLPVARSLASWGGVALVSLVVVVWNGLVLDAVIAARERARYALVGAGAGVALALVLVVLGHAARYDTTATGRLRVALLQGNDKNRELTRQEINARYLTESHFALAAKLDGPFDLIVFPESALDTNPQTDVGLQARIAAVGADHGSAVLVNALTPAPQGGNFNTNLLYEPDGDLQGAYAKQHLVPFGEYVPLRDRLRFLDELDQIPYDYEPGEGRRLFEVDGHQIGTIICFESAFGPLVRDFVRDGAEVVVVTTNNRSYRRSGNAAQHLALGQMRAAETGRPVLHASISGITGVIDSDGDVHDTTELFVNEVVTAEVTTARGRTPYVRYGDWVIWGSGLALVAAAAYGRWRHRPGRASSQTTP
ncbi:MAG: apolipoprotein N-acyltransferase [Acidimicrobiia bacterium]